MPRSTSTRSTIARAVRCGVRRGVTFGSKLGIPFVLLLVICTTALVIATPGKHEERVPRELHPRGECSAEQMARLAAEPSVTITTNRVTFSDLENELLADLRAAKSSGDRSGIIRVEEELATLRGEQLEFLPTHDQQPAAPFTVIQGEAAAGASPDGDADAERWLPHEFLLAGGDYLEQKPTLATDNDGNLYAAFEVDIEPYEPSIMIYISRDGGEHWEQFNWLIGAAGVGLADPSLAVAEGGENWLFVAFERTDEPNIYMFRQNLDTGDWNFSLIDDNVAGLSNPRIVTDHTEYTGWYVYLVYNAMAVDNWVFLHTRTLDWGESWETPEIVGGYCGYPGEFYDATDARPDIEYGSNNVYIAFDNYPSPCTTPQRDIFILTSENYGATWDTGVQLTSYDDDEHDPAVAAIKHYTTAPTTIVAYTRHWSELDDDVWVRYTQDDGANWYSGGCIACSTMEERNINLVTSNYEGAIHGAFWDESNINYAVSLYETPTSFVRQDSLSTSNSVSDNGYRPGILADPTKPTEEEAGIAWTDNRNEASMGLDIYFDAAVLPEPPDDYYLYTTFNPGVGACCAIDGFVDEAGAIEGLPGAQYVIFTGGPLYEGDITAYVFRVETAGDPETHPDNPVNTGPIAPRTFTYVNEHYMGHYANAHDNAFYVDATGIYYGPSDNSRNGVDGWATFMGCAIYHWDFDWTLLGCVVPTAAPGGNQTLARNPNNGDWWAGTGGRRMYRWNGVSWELQFTAPHLGGSHHDGLEVIGSSLYVSDMTSDAIIQYRLDDLGNSMDPPGTPAKTFFYTASPAVEGLGHDPNGHIWISGSSAGIYEIGGGALQLALEGIPNQCVLPGEAFDTFDLDDYTAGIPPYTWDWAGNVDLNVSVNASNVVTVTYPPDWMGQETITFTVTDGLDRVASDQAVFTVCPMPAVGDIPDQTEPFVTFDLDDYLLDGLPELISWSASGMVCLDVDINAATHVVTVTNPGGACTAPEVITFTAAVAPCEDFMVDADEAIFEPVVLDVQPGSVLSFRLGRPTPNPCTTSTQVSYAIPSGATDATVTLAVYDVAGHLVRTLVNDSGHAAERLISWDGNDSKGAPAPSGTYFFQLSWNGKYQSQRVVLLR